MSARVSTWVIGGLALLVLQGSSCEDTPPAQQDLPDEKVEQNLGERLIYVDPDKYPNVLTFCDGPVRVYVPVSESGPLPIEVVNNHPFCTGGEPGG
jgi:hypothetical protein